MPVKINVQIYRDGLGLQMLDSWFAYRQSQSRYEPDIQVSFNRRQDINDLNIWFAYMPRAEPTNCYDLMLFCNGGEPLLVATEYIKHAIYHPNCYLIANSLLTSDHEMADKVIWDPSNIKLCRDYWTRSFYPQYFENMVHRKSCRDQGMIIINGINRSWRHDIFSKVSGIDFYNNLSAGIAVTEHAYWESEYDTVYRNYLELTYGTQPQIGHSDDLNVYVGIDKKFGMVKPGYFVMPEYFKYQCVVFPETSWQNNELAITEKVLKCFYAGSVPFPVGGANINKLYNQIGFQTAWNLLPEHLQNYDAELDHVKRVEQTVSAIHWLNDHQSLFQSPQCEQMRVNNLQRFLTCDSDYQSVLMLDKILMK